VQLVAMRAELLARTFVECHFSLAEEVRVRTVSARNRTKRCERRESLAPQARVCCKGATNSLAGAQTQWHRDGEFGLHGDVSLV
jgi:hypothetical protein